MPELPDVETFRRYLDATSLHQRIRRAVVEAPELVHGVSARRLRRILAGQALASSERHGKYLFGALESDGWLVLHFGMTGGLAYSKLDKPLPRHTRLWLEFDNGYRLAYRSQRKLGRIALTGDPRAYAAERGLGPDALDPELDLERFRALMAKRRGKVKGVLMDQGLIAGIGNIYADEVLFQAGIRPTTRVDAMGDEDVSRLYDAMRSTLQATIEAQADPEQMPEGFLLPQRHQDGRCPRCGRALARVRVSGRTSYYCPRCQPA
ncbi:MAG: Fpg/Nei family DNA glycosylase [Gammaproteobacteria bacterium]|nr:Fpg/Nei family DNA glycosylase [Gammaproteobacteria bacterium]